MTVVEQLEVVRHANSLAADSTRTTLSVPGSRLIGWLHEPQITIGLHFYQPPRQAAHQRLEHINPDPGGQNWTEVIYIESYKPMEETDLLGKVTYDYQGTLDRQLVAKHPETANAYKARLRTNGVASSAIHLLLPDSTWEDKTAVVEVGIDEFIKITGDRPKYFWLPETAIDTPTLQVLADHGIEGFFCAPDQIHLKNDEPADNLPTRINLAYGRSILAIPYDGVVSHKLAFEDDPNNRLRDDAYRFRDEVIMPRLRMLRDGSPLVTYMDGEIGHHMRWGVSFLAELVDKALPNAGVKVVSIHQVDMSKASIAEGWIKERSAWSCSHPNLAMWRGECNCGAEGLDVGWKRPFYQAVHDLNWAVTQVVKPRLGSSYLKLVVNNFEEAFQNPGSPHDRRLSLMSAKVSALTDLTSCVTYFKDPGVSGGINILFARQAIEHLIDAGLTEDADRIWGQFLDTMQQVRNPAYHNRSGVEMTRDLLGDIAA